MMACAGGQPDRFICRTHDNGSPWEILIVALIAACGCLNFTILISQPVAKQFSHGEV